MNKDDNKDVPRRSRGRPRKVKKVENEQAITQGMETVRRGRGRPRKVREKPASNVIEAEVVSPSAKIPKLLQASETITFLEAVELDKRCARNAEKYLKNRADFKHLTNSSTNLSLSEKKRLTEALEKLEASVKEDEDHLASFSTAERDAISAYIDEERTLVAIQTNHQTDVDLLRVELQNKEKTLLDARVKLRSAVAKKKLLRSEAAEIEAKIKKVGLELSLVKKLATINELSDKADKLISSLQLEVTSAQRELSSTKQVFEQCETLKGQYAVHVNYHKFKAGGNISLYDFTKTKAKGGHVKLDESSFFDSLAPEEKSLFAKLNRPTRQNLVQGRYICSDSNEIWVSDWFTRGTGTSAITVLVVTDLGSRFILASNLYKTTTLTSGEVMGVLTSLFEEFGKPKIFHTDQAPAFKSEAMSHFLSDYGVAQSLDTKLFRKFDNQVAEAVNSSLARFLEIQRSADKQQDTFDFHTGESSKYYGINFMLRENLRAQTNFVRAAVAHYNLCSKATVESMSRRDLYFALANVGFKYGIVCASDDTKALIAKEYHRTIAAYTHSDEKLTELEQTTNISQTLTVEIRKIFVSAKTQLESVVPEFKDLENLTKLFKQMYQVVEMYMSLVESRQEKILLNTEETKSEVHILGAQLDSMMVQNAVLSDKLASLQASTDLLVNAQREKEEASILRKAKASRRQKRLKRGFIKDASFVQILNSVIGNTPLLVSRDRLALIIMKLCAFRIGQMKTFTIGNLRDMQAGKRTEVILIKNDQPYPFPINPSKNQRQWLACFQAECDILNQHYQKDNACPWGLSRSHFNRRINAYLKAHELLKNLSIPIRSQSLRITSLTKAIQEKGIVHAKEIAGHKNIATTMTYYRNQLTTKEQKAVYDSINPITQELKDSIEKTGLAYSAFYNPKVITNGNSISNGSLEIEKEDQAALQAELNQVEDSDISEVESLEKQKNKIQNDSELDPFTKSVLLNALAVDKTKVETMLSKLPDDDSSAEPIPGESEFLEGEGEEESETLSGDELSQEDSELYVEKELEPATEDSSNNE
jgi:transposase InsO family protein/integrase